MKILNLWCIWSTVRIFYLKLLLSPKTYDFNHHFSAVIGIGIVAIVIFVICVCTSILMIIGAKKVKPCFINSSNNKLFNFNWFQGDPRKIIPWLILEKFCITLSLLSVFRNHENILFNIFFIGTRSYLWFCVFSLYKSLDKTTSQNVAYSPTAQKV